jgi:LysM repeat protein
MICEYTIQKGDTLWAIGKDVGLNWRFIYAMNKSKISDPDKIYIGQVINVPNKSLIYYLSLAADIIMILCPYKISIFIELLRFII